MPLSQVFGLYGELCALYPWEVIVAVVALVVCTFSLDITIPIPQKPVNCVSCPEEQYVGPNAVIMTFLRCLTILYCYHQFRKMKRIGSKHLVGIVAIFAIFSTFVFMWIVLNVMKIGLIDLKDAISVFFFLLLIDASKAIILAQYVLTASNQDDIRRKVARGMVLLVPNVTLDSIVEVLVIGIGTVSGVYRLEMLSYYACLSVVINYIVFMTFYPACLSLMLELSKIPHHKSHEVKSNIEDYKSNPAVQSVKLIMSLGLIVVHLYSYWCLANKKVLNKITSTSENDVSNLQNYSYNYLVKQFSFSADHIVILILLVTLIIKFIFFETKDHLKELNSKPPTQDPLQNYLSNLPKRTRTLTENVEVQTEACQDPANFNISRSQNISSNKNRRTLEECLQIYRAEFDASSLTDEEVMLLVDTKHIPSYNLEKVLKNPERGVEIRRRIIESMTNCEMAFQNLPYLSYDYSKVMGACCENVVGYVPVPLGLAGPLLLDGEFHYIPMATTEEFLVASTNKGCRAVEKTGVTSRIEQDGMTRAPLVQFPSAADASFTKQWMETPENYAIIKAKFDSTSRFARLSNISIRISGRYLFLRFIAETGDAMGMNMLSKGTEQALRFIKSRFPEMRVLSLSSNVCTDKKPSSVNWIEGRGKSVVCECVIPGSVVSAVLKTDTQKLVELNITRNYYGSETSGTIGGYNSQASSIVTAIYIATGQDPAQNVGSSNCMTVMEPYDEKGNDLYVSCMMPSIEVGTVGGGTVLAAQSSCLELLGAQGSNKDIPGDNAKQLARLICGAVLAGELSFLAEELAFLNETDSSPF